MFFETSFIGHKVWYNKSGQEVHNREKQQENLEGYVNCNQLAADKLTTLIMTQIKDEKDETPQLIKMNPSTNTRPYMKKFHYSTSSQFKNMEQSSSVYKN